MRRMKALVADLMASLPPERRELLQHFERRQPAPPMPNPERIDKISVFGRLDSVRKDLVKIRV